MAAAATILDVLTEDGFMQDVRERAAYLESALTNLQSAFPTTISEIRGRGFLRGICLAEGFDVMALVSALRGDHVLCVPAAENTLRLLPPLTISTEEIDLAVAKIAKGLNDTPKHDSQ